MHLQGKAPMGAGAVELDHVAGWRADVIHLDFTLRQGAFLLELHEQLAGGITALFGPSGAGKTTTLDAIAGLRRPSSGRIVVADRVLFDASRGIDMPPHTRHIGYVPQDSSDQFREEIYAATTAPDLNNPAQTSHGGGFVAQGPY